MKQFCRICLIGAFLCGLAFAQNPTDLNSDGEFDVGDVVSATNLIGDGSTTASTKTFYDFNRSGIVQANDVDFLASILIGSNAFLPDFQLGGELFGSNTIFTNQDSVSFEIMVSQALGDFRVLVNDEEIFAGNGSGSTQALVEGLVEGINVVDVMYLDDQSTITRFVEVLLDTVAPSIRIDTPVDNQVIQSLTVPVTGQALDDGRPVKVTVNGQAMAVAADGTWSGNVKFRTSGPVLLNAIVTDLAGNTGAAQQVIELYVSPPETLDMGTARLDLPVGAICLNGEEAEIDTASNQDIKDVLGPGSENLVTSMPLDGLTTGVVILPSAIMVDVISGNTVESNLVGAENLPMFANRPSLSLENVGGADNSVPMWIFQVIPDTDGNGYPELSMVSRAKIAEDGPNAGRVVPIEPIGDEPFAGTFNPDLPVFDNQTMGQVARIPAVQRLAKRLEERKQNNKGPSPPATRITFYCCAAAGTIAAEGKVNCDNFDNISIIEEIGNVEVELELLAIAISAREKLIAQADSELLAAGDTFFGTSNAVTNVFGEGTFTIIQGKGFACATHMITGGASSQISTYVDKATFALDAVQDLNAAITQEPDRSVTGYSLRLSNLLLDGAGDLAFARSINNDFNFIVVDGTVQKLRKVKSFLGSVGVINDCYQAFSSLASGYANTRLLNEKVPQQQADMAKYAQYKRQYDRLIDCQRKLIAKARPELRVPVEKERWLGLKATDFNSIEARILAAQNYISEIDMQNQLWIELLDDFIAIEESGGFTDNTQVQAFTQRYAALLADDIDLGSRNQSIRDGFNALREVLEVAPLITARIRADLAFVEQSNTDAFAARNGYVGASVSLQGSGSPYTTVSGRGGRFMHFVFSQMRAEGTLPDRYAIFNGADFTAESIAADGAFTGQLQGRVPELRFPFTPFSTVEFDEQVDIGTIPLDIVTSDTGNMPPLLEITFPDETFKVPAGYNFRIETTSSDDVAVLGVEVSTDGVSQIGLPGGVAQGIVRANETIGPMLIEAAAVDPAGLITTDSVTVEVIDPDGALVVDPASIRIGQNESFQFTARFLGQPVDNATWRVNGFIGGQAGTVGTISTQGLYDASPADFGGVAGAVVIVTAELPQFPQVEARARVLLVDSRDVIAPAVAFGFSDVTTTGGLITSAPIGFSFSDATTTGGLITSGPIGFSFTDVTTTGGLVVSRPIAIDRQ